MIERILFKKISASGLAVFRIAYHLVFLFEIFKIFNYRQLYFDEIPFLKPHFPDTTLILILWLFIIFSIIIGYRTKLFSIINYIFGLVFISSAVSFEYHMFYAYTGMNFLFMFLPSSSAFSLDYLRKKFYLAKQGKVYIAPKVSKINYFIPVFLGLALVYFDSVIFYKFKSNVWMNGLGLWLPSSLPHVTISDFQWILNQEMLVKFLSYVTLVFEFVFLFIFWIKKFRIPLFVIGLALHVGIYFEYPIPYFALGCMSIYLLMVPVSLWDNLNSFFKKKFSSYVKGKKIENVFLFFEKQFEANNSVSSKSRFKLRNNFSSISSARNAFFVFLIAFSILAQRQVYYSFFNNKNITYKVNEILKEFLGITGHSLFIDDHFEGYNNVFTLKFKGQFLPFLNEEGMPDKYISGGSFAYWTFRTNGPYVKEKGYRLEKGLMKFSAFWIYKNDLNTLSKIEFDIVKKEIRGPMRWEKDLLKKNIEAPWQNVGKLIWSNGRTKFDWSLKGKNNNSH